MKKLIKKHSKKTNRTFIFVLFNGLYKTFMEGSVVYWYQETTSLKIANKKYNNI